MATPTATFRLLLSRAHQAHPFRKITRPHLVDILKGKFKAYHTKYGVEVPGAFGFAHASSKGPAYSAAWTVEEQEEINKLSADDSFIKGLTVADLPTNKTIDDVIKTQ